MPKAAPAPARYRCVAPLTWTDPDGAEHTARPGDVVTDLPTGSVGWLTEQGLIYPAHVDDRLDAMTAAARGEEE